MGMSLSLLGRLGINGFILLMLVACANGNMMEQGACEALTVMSQSPVPSLIEKQYSEDDPKAERWLKERPCVQSYASGFPGGAEEITSANPEEVRKDLQYTLSLFDIPHSQLKRELSTTLEAENPSDFDVHWQRKLHIVEGWDRQLVELFGSSLYLKRLSEEGEFSAFDEEISRLKSKFDLKARPLAEWNDLEANTYFSRQALVNIIRVYELRVSTDRAAIESLDAEELYRRANELAAQYSADRVAIAHLSPIINGPEDALVELCKNGQGSE